MKIQFTFKYLILIAIFGLVFLPVSAAMRSSNYIIDENVNFEFDGPVISSVSAGTPDSTSVTITWTTNVLSDSFVKFDTDAGFTASQEQGSDLKNTLSHSVTLEGLSPVTNYFFEVKSTGLNNGMSETSLGGSFTTAQAVTVPAPTSGGGGIIIIDKTDKVSPKITDVKVQNIKSNEALVTWTTDEVANSFVEFGINETLGNIDGAWDTVITHSIIIKNLLPDSKYYFRVLSSDGSGNLTKTEILYFKTLTIEEEVAQSGEKEVGNPEAELSLLERYNLLKQLAGLLPTPVITGEPKVDVWPDRAVITWSTDKDTNSMVALAVEGAYNPEASEPYAQVVGDFENYTKEHSVEIINLKPNTNYNYQVRIKPLIGETSQSGNFIFRTIEERLSVENYYYDILENNAVRFKWVTNADSDTSIKFTPYRNNVLSPEDAKTNKDNIFSVIHDMVLSDLEAGVSYDIELISMDKEGNVALESIKSFSTAKDNTPPEVSQVKTSSTIFLNKNDSVQTIISWKTNEPVISRVYYTEGVHGAQSDWPQKTEMDNNYTKNHVVVINDFKPGVVYSFRLEDTDSSGNSGVSKVFTFITPKKKESIFQLIISIMENVFGWIVGNK